MNNLSFSLQQNVKYAFSYFRFITHDLKTEDPKTFQGLKEICITDVSEGNCVVFHPQLRSQVTSKKVLEKLSAAQSVRSRLPVWRVRLRGAAVDERDLQLPTGIVSLRTSIILVFTILWDEFFIFQW